MDIVRNVCVRETYSETASFLNQKVVPAVPPMSSFKNATDTADVRSSNSHGSQSIYKHRNSLPNVCLIDMFDEKPQPPQLQVVSANHHRKTFDELVRESERDGAVNTQQNTLPMQLFTNAPDVTANLHASRASRSDDDGFINGRLEIRVIPKGIIQHILLLIHSFIKLLVYIKENLHLDESVYYDALAAAIKTPNTNTFPLSNRGSALGDAIFSLSDKDPIDCDDIETASLANRNKNVNEEIVHSNLLRNNKEFSETPPLNFSSCSIQSGEANKVKLNGTSNGVKQIKSDSETSHIKSKVQSMPASEVQVETSSQLTPSKIPVLTSNLRQLKCASWAGVDTSTVGTSGAFCLQNPTPDTFAPTLDITDNPKKGQQFFSTLHNSQNNADLTPGLSSFYYFIMVYGICTMT